ncbi:nucleoside deaminase [Fodinicurvata sp. EGI_FJ10296]|uniref:nucleoside deaminase n=1 Tax=Fodinicurvata sp. EGI_FJ10296 TaxID=3231908 RepID=UPI0034551EAD
MTIDGMTDEGATTAADRRWLRRAIALSRSGMEADCGGPFGAVIVRNGAVLAEGSNRVTSDNDPTAHAEIVAIRRACAAADDFSLAGAVLYASCEPCPMCLAAAYWARVDRIVFAACRDDAAAAGFDDAHIYRELALAPDQRSLPMVALLRDEANAVFSVWNQKEDRIAY